MRFHLHQLAVARHRALTKRAGVAETPSESEAGDCDCCNVLTAIT